MNVLTTILGLINPALGILGAFTGSAKAAKASDAIQDAINVVTSLVPLVDQFASGKEVTPEQVRSALAGMDHHIAAFDTEIARQGG